MRPQNTQFWVGSAWPHQASCACPIPSALEGLAAVSARGTAVACGCPLLPMFAFRERIRRQRQYIDMEGERLAGGEGRIAATEDLAAETFATAYRRRACFEPGRGSLRSWLYGIAANLVRSHWRAEQHLLALDARLVPEVDLPDGCDEVTQRVTAALLAPRLAAALGQLTRDQRDVLLLHAWAGLSHEEIAAALQIGAGTDRK